MIWAEKPVDWGAISSEIKSLMVKFQRNFATEKTADIEHYLEHGELSAAFEYLVLEIIEGGVGQSDVNLCRLTELALLFGLNDEDECMIDGDFWPKFQKFASQV